MVAVDPPWLSFARTSIVGRRADVVQSRGEGWGLRVRGWRLEPLGIEVGYLEGS